MNNSDYNFMKAGRSNLIEPPKLSDSELESIDVLLSVFISNAMINSSNYVSYCGRNGVSTTDLVYGLRYEVFEFFSRPNLNNDIAQMTEDTVVQDFVSWTIRLTGGHVSNAREDARYQEARPCGRSDHIELRTFEPEINW